MTDNTSELEASLAQAQTPGARIEALNELAWQLRHTQPEWALSLSQEAESLATSGEFATQPDRLGQATSLTTQAYLNHQNGKLDLALSQCFAAATLLETLPPSRVSIDCRRIISWIYYFLGDTANALNYGLQALRLAQDLNLRVQEATVLDGLALIYVDSGDAQQGLESNESAVHIARTAGDPLLETTALNNRANVLLKTGDTAAALEAALSSLELARQMSLVGQQISILATVGDILLAKGDLAQAEQYLNVGLELSRQAGHDLGQIDCLLGLGKVGLRRADLEQAQTYLDQALTRATASGTQALQAECHALLAELCERQGQAGQALEHYKSFHTLHDRANGELSGKRRAALKVAHQVETAQRDTEIYRLRNVELQGEIDERNRVQAELQRLAATDPLTNLYNRRHFFELAQRELDRSVRYRRPLTALMLDLDHFKAINDAHGHAAGDQVLALFSAFLLKILRGVDLIGRYGGEEFCIVLTETDAAQGRLAARRLQHSLEQQSFETSGGKIHLTISIGLASLPAKDAAWEGGLDQLLGRADQALYRAKQAGRNRVEVAWA
jgi:diguanylate cyclase (GGDEF)-like protein